MKPMMQKIADAAAFARDETGSASVAGLMFTVVFATLGAVAVDITNLYAARTHLQVAADQAAHAALYNRNYMDADTAKTRALDVVLATLPSDRYGAALTEENIEFGYYSRVTGFFTVDEASNQAVRVRTSFLEERTNAVSTYLFKLVGYDSFDVATQAIYTTYRPACMREGFVAEDYVDIQSNNGFTSGFCIHSNTYVSLNSNNYFEPGTVVSMPDLQNLDLPKSGFETNEGLRAALRQSQMNIRILDRIDGIIARFQRPTSDLIGRDIPDIPAYITNLVPVRLNSRTITSETLVPGFIYHLSCSGKSVTINANTPLRGVVVVAPCEIKFANNSTVEDAIIISTDTGDNSINSPSGLQLGRNDNCAEGGGVQVITKGGMNFASDLSMYGSQLIAEGDIEFAANANGIQGASIISAATINGTSNMDMGFCGTGMEGNFEIDYFRLAL